MFMNYKADIYYHASINCLIPLCKIVVFSVSFGGKILNHKEHKEHKGKCPSIDVVQQFYFPQPQPQPDFFPFKDSLAPSS